MTGPDLPPPSSVRRDDATAFALLLLAAFVCYGGARIARLGFYLDDWHLLAGMAFAPPGLIPAMQGLVAQAGAIIFRPFEIPFFAGLYLLNGLDPLRWQISLLAVNFAAAWSLRGLMLRFGAGGGAALLSALLFLSWPSKDSTLFWPCTVFLPFSLVAFLGAYRLHLRFVENGSLRALGAAAACLLASLTSYDQCLLLFPLWIITPSSGAAARRRALQGTALAAAVSALVLTYQFALVPRLTNYPHNKETFFSLAHAFLVYARGADSLFGPDMLRTALSSARAVALHFPFLAGCAAVSAAGAYFVRGDPGRGRPGARLILFATGLIVLGFLPLVFSVYVPVPFSHMNRINLVPAAGAALLAGELLSRASRGRAGLVLGLIVAWVFIAASVRSAGSWAESYRKQRVLREAVMSNLESWPPETTLLIRMPELYVDGVVPIFLAHYDSSAAFQIWTGARARRADVITPATRYTHEGVDINGRKTPYSSVRLLDAATGTISKMALKPAPR